MGKINITLYTDGSCSGNPGPGGFAAILVAEDEQGEIIKEREVLGGASETTNNRMEMSAVIAGLETLMRPSSVHIVSDSQYVINTMTKNWKRRKNKDLWSKLDELCTTHHVTWEYVKGHDGHEYNERCDQLANGEVDNFRTQ